MRAKAPTGGVCSLPLQVDPPRYAANSGGHTFAPYSGLGGEGLGVIGDELFVVATGSDAVLAFDVSGAQASGTCAEILWLYQDPISSTVAVHDNLIVDLTFDASVITQTGNIMAPCLCTIMAFQVLYKFR